MAGYSGTPLSKKLGVVAGSKTIVLGAPPGFAIEDLPPGVEPKTRLSGGADVVVFFTKVRAALSTKLPALMEAVFPDGAAWVAWPKKTSKVPTDVTEDVVREVALPLGLVDVKVCAIDETWSGLKLVVRKELRARGGASSGVRR
jgi:hypothetical protein